MNEIKIFKWKSCKCKRKYVNLKEVINTLLSKQQDGIDVDSGYKCVFCDAWHIGHYGNIKQRKRTRRRINLVLERRKI